MAIGIRSGGDARRGLIRAYIRLLLSLFCVISPSACHAITALDLTCEYMISPLDVDLLHPRLSFILHSTIRGDKMSGVRVLVSSSLELLNRNKGDLWDARLNNVDSINIEYRGKPPTSSQVCYWKVQPFDKSGAAGSWSAPAKWEMGILSPREWTAKWIDDGKLNPTKDADFYKPDPAPLFRKAFATSGTPIRARLAISGLGYYEARINGKRVGDALLAPAWTNYAKRVSYTVYDVTSMIRSGANCLGVTLGNGWYNPLPLRMWGTYNLRDTLPVGRPRFIAQLDLYYPHHLHKRVISDDTWSVAEGPLQFNSIYLGEIYDARQERPGWDRPEAAGSGWRSAGLSTKPVGRLEAQYQPPIRITAKVFTKAVTQPKPGIYIFDMGRNFAGLVQLNVSEPAGTKIVLRYGELLNKDGTLNPMTSVAGQVKGTHRLPDGTVESIGGPGAPPIAWQTDIYITKGAASETYTPSFTFHGFRYVEVTGIAAMPKPAMLLGLRMNSDVPHVGEFSCSDPVINRIQQMCDNTFLSNLFSVQSDCPHRERFGYGGDLVATCDAFMMNYDMSRFYAKSVRDWSDAALPDGMLTDTAPFVGIQYCGLAWAMAHPLVQRRLYQYYGDRRLIKEQFPVSRLWLDLVDKQFPDHIVTSGLSDHESIAPVSVPVLLTPLYAYTSTITSELAGISSEARDSGDPEKASLESDKARYSELAAQILKAYQAKFVGKDGFIGNNTTAAYAFALELNAIPESARSEVEFQLDQSFDRKDNRHVSTGIFGTNFLLDYLSQDGNGERAYDMVTQDTQPGWKYMLDNGATTLWEHWAGSDNTYSQNHPMFGSVSQWICQWLGGIAPAKDAVGFNKIEIHPLILSGMSSASYRYRSVRGDVVCKWRSTGESDYVFDIEVPAGASAILDLSSIPIIRGEPALMRERGSDLSNAPGVTVKHVKLRNGNDEYKIELQSGKYHFTTESKLIQWRILVYRRGETGTSELTCYN